MSDAAGVTLVVLVAELRVLLLDKVILAAGSAVREGVLTLSTQSYCSPVSQPATYLLAPARPRRRVRTQDRVNMARSV